MAVADLLLRRRSRAVWHDPVRTVLTLESFSRTEEDGGKDIGSACRKVGDPELRGHLERHAADEVRHAGLFRDRAQQLRDEMALANLPAPELDDKGYDLSRGRPAAEVDAHGFFTAGFLDELGEVAYVAMLHAAEVKAARLFQMHKELTAHDPATRSVFESILRDENYHVAWTRTMLDRWKREGRGREVSAAKAAARGGRLWSSWKRLGLRSGAGFSRFVLRVLYVTVLVPFGLLARRGKPASGWQASAPGPDAERALRSQY